MMNNQYTIMNSKICQINNILTDNVNNYKKGLFFMKLIVDGIWCSIMIFLIMLLNLM